jgi:ERCC4-type nuclease
MLIAMALQGGETSRELAETDRILADYRERRDQLIRELEDLRVNLRRIRDATKERKGDDRV